MPVKIYVIIHALAYSSIKQHLRGVRSVIFDDAKFTVTAMTDLPEDLVNLLNVGEGGNYEKVLAVLLKLEEGQK